jgi:tRNA (mo5U34)-methyltransferase
VQSISEAVAGQSWYHTIELPGGVVTPGVWNTIASRKRVPLPASLVGKRCLDVATADGFWAFEMEKLGADEVIGIDVKDSASLDWPATVDEATRREDEAVQRGAAFRVAKEALGSSVERVEISVYELSPDELGTFDFAFVGDLLLHLRDPVGALRSITRVVTGELLSVDCVAPLLTVLHPWQPIGRLEAPGWPLWWVVNLAGYRRMFPAAGWEVLRSGPLFWVKPRPGFRHRQPRAARPLLGPLRDAAIRHVGLLHSWTLARPGIC